MAGRVGTAKGVVIFYFFSAGPGAHVCVWRTAGISLQWYTRGVYLAKLFPRNVCIGSNDGGGAEN